MTANDLVATAANDLLRRIDRAQVHTAFSPNGAPRIWNAAVKHRPAVVVRARAARGVQQAIRVARECALPLSVLGGGHDWAGRALCDGGLLIDLSRMRGVRVDALTVALEAASLSSALTVARAGADLPDRAALTQRTWRPSPLFPPSFAPPHARLQARPRALKPTGSRRSNSGKASSSHTRLNRYGPSWAGLNT